MRFSFSVGETRSKGGAAATKKNNICKRFGPRICSMLVSSTSKMVQILIRSHFDQAGLLLKPSCCKKHQKKSQPIGFGNREHLNVLNITKLVLNKHE